HAKATVKMSGDVLLGVAADAKGKLDGSPSGASPSIAYPIDGALFPSAFATPEFHVQGGPAQGIGRVAFASDLLDLRVYATCAALTGGCALVLDDALVPILAGASEAGPLTARARVAGADGSGLGETGSIGVGWTFGKLGGALYFWRAINHDVKTA